MILSYILLVIIWYILIFFVFSRLVIPFMGFRPYSIPRKLPSEMGETLHELEQQSRTPREFAERTYNFIQKRWHAERARTLTKLPLIFRTDLEQIWQTPGYAHCTTINFIFVCLLANSKFFKATDIKIRHRFFNGVLHQYVLIHIDGHWLPADPSVTYLHLPFGQRSHSLFG